MVEAYAAGALDAADRARFERHLVDCPTCRVAAAAYADLLTGLPEALAAADPAPPAWLRARVLRAALEDTEDTTDRDPAPVAPPVPAVLGAPARPTRARLAGPAGTSRWPAQRVALVAAALVVALGGVWGIQQGVALARERAQLRAEYAALVSQQETVLEVVDARNTIKRNLAPADGSGGPTAPYGKLYTRP